MPGDIIWVNKTSYGKSMFNCVNKFLGVTCKIGNLFTSIQSIHLSSGDVKYGDVIVFKSPQSRGKNILVKRCIGLPGQKVEIRDNTVLIDGLVKREFYPLMFSYYFESKTDTLLRLVEKLALNDSQSRKNRVDQFLAFHLDAKEVFQIRNLGLKIKRVSDFKKKQEVFPKSKQGRWSYINYGPIWIPKKGRRIVLSDSTLAIYGSTIKKFESCTIQKRENGLFYIKGVKSSTYRFNHNYHFVLGDNRHNALDSRYFGFVPDFLIEGRVSFVLFNWYNINRFLTKTQNNLDGYPK